MTASTTFSKPLVVLQKGDGKIDDSCLFLNSGMNALIWGRTRGLPAHHHQYPIDYVHQIPTTDMVLRPSTTSPRRTYMWYMGAPVFRFGVAHPNLRVFTL
ncbi:hypothetical protein WOLCODRAFT_150452 [Wolfiporia cocos MD-104 SS10]|uniref:Uncharacterized protein n=1 Tax=Wolfiporia cocos (strain MD-104) TaxID=742152 RepID=A0A2H3JFU6_WOLCO|nr:hypothetical protein WOLCODRAFT_150452 [Wolfiporia cocos MD-104 SS10]